MASSSRYPNDDCTVCRVSISAWRANPFLRMVPFTIFHRLSSLGSGGGVKAGTFPPEDSNPDTDLFFSFSTPRAGSGIVVRDGTAMSGDDGHPPQGVFHITGRGTVECH